MSPDRSSKVQHAYVSSHRSHHPIMCSYLTCPYSFDICSASGEVLFPPTYPPRGEGFTCSGMFWLLCVLWCLMAHHISSLSKFSVTASGGVGVHVIINSRSNRNPSTPNRTEQNIQNGHPTQQDPGPDSTPCDLPPVLFQEALTVLTDPRTFQSREPEHSFDSQPVFRHHSN